MMLTIIRRIISTTTAMAMSIRILAMKKSNIDDDDEENNENTGKLRVLLVLRSVHTVSF
jgi:hypothetical protein